MSCGSRLGDEGFTNMYYKSVTFWFSVLSPDAAEVEEGINGPSTSTNIITDLTSLFCLTFLFLLLAMGENNIFIIDALYIKCQMKMYIFRHTAYLNTVRYSSTLFIEQHYVSPSLPPHSLTDSYLCHYASAV